MSRSTRFEPPIILLATIELKNVIESNYKEFSDGCSEQTLPFLIYLKQEILGNFLHTQSGSIHSLYLKMVKTTIDVDFPSRWDGLVQGLSNALSSQNDLFVQNSFEVLKYMTKKYEILERSDELYMEIIEIGNVFHDPLVFFLEKNIDSVLTGKGTVDQLCQMVTQLKIFYRLIY